MGRPPSAFSTPISDRNTPPAMPVPTMMAAVGGISQATGLPIETGMVSLTAGATALLLPYVAAPMVVGLAIGKVDQRIAAKFTLWSALISYVTIIPLNAMWWKLIGALP